MKLSKHINQYKNYLGTAIEYRANLVGNLIQEAISLSGRLLLVFAIFANNSSVAGYSRSEIIIYYVITPIMGFITLSMASDTLGKQIKRGELSNYLLKPQKIWIISLMKNLADKTFYVTSISVVYILGLIIVFYFFPGNQLTTTNIFIGLAFGALGFTIQFTMDIAIAWLAFWFDDVWAFKHVKDIFFMILGGSMFPLELFPDNIEKMVSLLPFKFMFYTPISYMVGTRSTQNIFGDLSLFFYWWLFLGLLSFLLWKKGIKRYEAFGN